MSSDALSITFAALADPTRRAILARLASGETSVSDLAAPFSMSLPAVSKHLKVLQSAGLITKARDAQWRPCRIEGAALKDAMGWIDQYKQFWEQRFDRLDAYLQTLPPEPGSPPVSARTTPTTPTTTETPYGRPKK